MNWSREYPGNSSAGYIRLNADGRDDSLFDRNMRMAQRDIQVAVGVAPVTERASSKTGHPARMACREWNLKTVGHRVREPVHRIRPKVWNFRCSPSVITGEPVASKLAMVSRIALS